MTLTLDLVQVYFSSLWRYEAGKNMVNAWHEYGVRVGVKEMVRLLQTLTHATTEHSIIYEAVPSRIDETVVDITLHVAVADMRVGGWHAPYLSWAQVPFREFFT